MYKPSKKMTSKGIIPERQPYFNERAYEYTFVSPGHEALMQALSQALEAEKPRNVSYRIYPDRPIVVIIGYSWKLEFYRSDHLDTSAAYTAFFSRWEALGNTLTMGDYMNQTLTILEKVLLSFDPCVWVRELYDHPHVTNGIMSRPEIWEADVPSKDMTAKEAAARKLGEYYLADMLNGSGFPVFGGTPFAQANNVPVNPLVAEIRKRNEEKAARRAEEAKKEPEPPEKRICAACGCELPADAKFCTKCGTPVKLTIEEKKAKEKTLKSFPPFFIVSPGEKLEPYVHSRVDEDGQLIEEKEDHGLRYIPLAGMQVYIKKKGDERYTSFYVNNEKHDNELYVSDARIVLLNRKYNKNEAGKWIGFGGLTAMAVSGMLNAAEKGIKAAQRKGQVLTGHIRYEWIANLYFHHKAKMLDHERIRVLYEDIEHTLWNLNLNLTNETDAEDLANFILQRACAVRYSMLDNKDPELLEFLEKYRNGAQRIPVNPDPGKMSGVVFPYHYYATKGQPYLPD